MLYSAVDQCFSVARYSGIQPPTVPKMQVLQQATNSATSVLGSTSGKNTWRMPTDFALSEPRAVFVADRLAARQGFRDALLAILRAHPIGQFRTGGAHIDREQRDHARHHDGDTPAAIGGDECR